MATFSIPENPLHSTRESNEERCYMARQPILDACSNVHGYELLFCGGRQPTEAAESELAARTVLDNSIVQGLERLARGLPAFVPCTANAITRSWVQMLPPNLTVVELPANSEPTFELMAACRQLKEMGFWLALNDFNGTVTPVTDLADYIKVDFAAHDEAARRAILAGFDKASLLLVAKNVETHEEFRQAAAEGFHLFQGYYFCFPELVRGHKIPGNRLVHLEILELLQNNPYDLHRLSQLVTCDASLTYRLLRLVNSPICAVRQEVTSIQLALVLIGQESFRRIATLAIASDFSAEQPPELLRLAYVRGRFCELAARLCRQTPAEQYLIGMVSLFPAMLHVTMEDLVRMLPLRQKASDALRGKDIPEGALLQWMIACERGNWAACDGLSASLGLEQSDLVHCHSQALVWAETSSSSIA
jgi:c-di-GMP phosphodiesterase